MRALSISWNVILEVMLAPPGVNVFAVRKDESDVARGRDADMSSSLSRVCTVSLGWESAWEQLKLTVWLPPVCNLGTPNVDIVILVCKLKVMRSEHSDGEAPALCIYKLRDDGDDDSKSLETRRHCVYISTGLI